VRLGADRLCPRGCDSGDLHLSRVDWYLRIYPATQQYRGIYGFAHVFHSLACSLLLYCLSLLLAHQRVLLLRSIVMLSFPGRLTALCAIEGVVDTGMVLQDATGNMSS
jgi:hypothetical protein